MELKISEWRSEGLRCPDGPVNLKKNGFKRFNFVQMPNGTGKTTYLELIQAALSGSLEEINVDGKTIGKMETGEIFGELSLILGEKRKASIKAITPSEIIEIKKMHWRQFFFQVI